MTAYAGCQFLVYVCLFLEPEIFGSLAVKPLHFFVFPAQIAGKHIGTAGTEIICGEDKLYRRLLLCPQTADDCIHILYKFRAVAFAGVALRTEQVMGSQTHAALTSLLWILSPIAAASPAFITAVGMNGSTQAVKPAHTLLPVTRQNIAMPPI